MLRIILLMVSVLLFAGVSYAETEATIADAVAKVNGAALTQSDLEVEVDRLIPQMSFHRNVSDEKRKTYYKKAIEEMINRELQYQDAVAKNIQPDKLKIDAQAEQFKKRFITDKEYAAFLEKKKLTEDTLKKQLEKDMLVQTIAAKTVTEPSQVSDADLQKYYSDNAGKFKQPENYKLRLISVRDEKKAQDILAKIKEGEDFAQLASTMSEDAYRVKAGDTGYVHKGRMQPELDEAASKMKTGETSEIIKAQGMFYIIRLEDKKPEHTVSFDEIKGKLKKDLEAKKTKELKEKWISELRSKAKIEIFLSPEPEIKGK